MINRRLFKKSHKLNESEHMVSSNSGLDAYNERLEKRSEYLVSHSTVSNEKAFAKDLISVEEYLKHEDE